MTLAGGVKITSSASVIVHVTCNSLTRSGLEIEFESNSACIRHDVYGVWNEAVQVLVASNIFAWSDPYSKCLKADARA